MKRAALVVVGLSTLVLTLPLALAQKPKAQQPAKTPDHAAMQKEHEEADTEHEKWLAEISNWRVEHLRTLSMLSKVQAILLEHEAVLEEHSEHVRMHDRHLMDHELEIAEHEAGGSGKSHSELMEKHKAFEAEHVKMRESQKRFREMHDTEVKDVRKLLESLDNSR